MSAFPGGSARPIALTMVVPTYNERERIAELVHAVSENCHAHQINVEIVIVDDNSPDGTGSIADGLAHTHGIRVIHRAGKLGLGSAVVAGVGIASGAVIGVMDADFSHPPAMVPKLFSVLQATQADIVVASRYIAGGSTPEWPLWRRIASRLACLAARPLSPVRDAASGFFLIRGDIARRVSIKAGGFKICLELVMRGWPQRVVEVPYRFDDREQGASKMSLREVAGYLVQLRDLYALRVSSILQRRRRRYQRISLEDVETMLSTARPRHAAAAAKTLAHGNQS